jgi:hypothetical protein
MKKVKTALALCAAATAFCALAFVNNIVAIVNWWRSFLAAGGDSSAFSAKAPGAISWLDWAAVDYSAVTTFIPMLGFLCMTVSLARMAKGRRFRVGDFPFFRGSDQLNVALGLFGTLWGIIVIGYFKLDSVTMADLMQCLHTALFSTLMAVVWVFLIDRPLVRPYFTRLLEETNLADSDEGDLASAVDRLVARLGAASDAFERRQREFEESFAKRAAQFEAEFARRETEYEAAHAKREAEYAAAHERRTAEYAADFEKRRGEYAAHFEERLAKYEGEFESRQKEYKEFFKREMDALDRRAKDAEAARLATEERLAKVASVLRG